MWPMLLCHRLNGSDICAMKKVVTYVCGLGYCVIG